MRPYWSGHIQISLVSFGVNFFTATNAASQVTLHQIDRRSGERIHHRKVTDDDSEGVDASNIVKGYEYRKGEYVTIEPGDLEKLRMPSKKTMAVTQFVNTSELPPAFFEKPYFVVPQDESQTSAFTVIREALAQSKKVALGEIAFAGREHLVALLPAPDKNSRGMMAYLLRYQDELRDASEYFANIKNIAVEKSQLELAKELIERNSSKFDPSKFTDDYEAALRAWVDAKVNEQPLPEEEEQPKQGKVINLMDALRKSLAKNGTDEKPSASKSSPSRSSSKKTARSAEKPAAKGPHLVPGKTQRKRKTA